VGTNPRISQTTRNVIYNTITDRRSVGPPDTFTVEFAMALDAFLRQGMTLQRAVAIWPPLWDFIPQSAVRNSVRHMPALPVEEMPEDLRELTALYVRHKLMVSARQATCT